MNAAPEQPSPPTTAGPGGAGPKSPRARLKKWRASFTASMKKQFTDHVVRLGFLGALAVLGGLWFFGLDWVRTKIVGTIAADFAKEQSRIANQVRNLVVSELQAEQSQIAAAFDGRVSVALGAAFEDRVGAVSAGRFNLNAQNTSQVVYVYLPPGYEGHLRVIVEGIIEGERVVMNTPRSRPLIFDRDLPSERLDISSMLASERPPTEEILVKPELGEMKHLYRLTFSLTQEAPGSELSSRVNLKYLMLISPPISKGEL